MADVFFSYSSKDRERVRPIRDALVAEGFDVFWDQEVSPGRNWDEWIREHLAAARFYSSGNEGERGTKLSRIA